MAVVIPAGLCQCGCGRKTTVPTKTDRSIGRVKGVPMRFARGHYADRKQRSPRGPDSHLWKGGRTLTGNGYVLVKVPRDHPMADPHGRTLEHRLVMAEAIGRCLETREHVHHINGDRTDNRLDNLMLFPSTAEHHHHHAELRRKARVG